MRGLTVCGPPCRRRPLPPLALASALAACGSLPLCCSKGTFEQMFLDLLAEQPRSVTSPAAPSPAAAASAGHPAEEWRNYFAFKGELPSAEELPSFSGIVITGSV